MWSKIGKWFSNLGRALLGFMGDLMDSIAKNGGPILVHAAEQAVIAAEKNGGTGDQKMAAAQAAVITTLTAEGIPVVLNAVRGAIEAAVAKMNAQ